MLFRSGPLAGAGAVVVAQPAANNAAVKVVSTTCGHGRAWARGSRMGCMGSEARGQPESGSGGFWVREAQDAGGNPRTLALGATKRPKMGMNGGLLAQRPRNFHLFTALLYTGLSVTLPL